MTEARNRAPGSTWLAFSGAILSLAVCYGAPLAAQVLAGMGSPLVLDEAARAGITVGFAALGALGVSHGWTRHRNPNPARLAIAGAALLYWAMYGEDNIRMTLGLPGAAVQVAGFAALLGAAWWDRKLQRAETAG